MFISSCWYPPLLQETEERVSRINEINTNRLFLPASLDIIKVRGFLQYSPAFYSFLVCRTLLIFSPSWFSVLYCSLLLLGLQYSTVLYSILVYSTLPLFIPSWSKDSTALKWQCHKIFVGIFFINRTHLGP